ncbi:MAG: glycerol-3-phosphate dehydrogenase [Alphaproteobacteria bacterium]|nr:glycerol-3-phosphate dehydrogenase [Alphaproteobacteria bacterium]
MAGAKEGSLGAPTRHAIPWREADFYDEAKLDAELRRVFDICHGCRRCFNLCDSFPRLFDLCDTSPSGELHDVKSAAFKGVVDACTLCDMCYLTKCPYVPPHEFNLDFPHLMLRYRAVELRKGQIGAAARALTETDRNGLLGMLAAPVANWASARTNRVTRVLAEKTLDIHRDAALPRFAGRTFELRAAETPLPVNPKAPGFGRKAVLYATCFVNYNRPGIGMAAREILARNGVATEVLYPTCCGMPQLEHGDIEAVAAKARKVATALKDKIAAGCDVIALTPSCALMLKSEWPLILPEDPDVKRLAAATKDIAEYIVGLARKEGLEPGLAPIEGGVTLHLACHARAQNIGAKAAEMLRLIPGAKVQIVERCSGHGGSWGVLKDNFEVGLKIGRPVAKQAAEGLAAGRSVIASECPLAGDHILQGMELVEVSEGTRLPARSWHPVEIFARAYGIATEARG